MPNNGGGMISHAPGYWREGVEPGDPDELHLITDPEIPPEIMDKVFDLSDNDYLYYRDYFIDRPTLFNYLGTDTAKGPISVSVVRDDTNQVWRALVRTSENNRRINVPFDKVKPSWWRALFRMAPSQTDILRAIDSTLPIRKLKRVTDPRLPQALLNLEERQTIKGFKFGLLYAQSGQTTEDEMFANVETSKEYEEFLRFLGKKVKLLGWANFRAGLDVKTVTTGKKSLYYKWNNNEIMYHVSTLLPYNAKDTQQLERKRHIGNDIVVVVFQEGDTEYRPNTISSRQVHVVIVVKALKIPSRPGKTYYRLAVVAKEEVPKFGPPIPANSAFESGKKFRDYFYAKLLNAEKASYGAPILGNKLSRTRNALLQELVNNFC